MIKKKTKRKRKIFFSFDLSIEWIEYSRCRLFSFVERFCLAIDRKRVNHRFSMKCFFFYLKFFFYLRRAFPSYVSSAYHVNYQLKLLTSNQLQLHDLLYHKSSLSYLIEVSCSKKIRRYSLEIESNLVFWTRKTSSLSSILVGRWKFFSKFDSSIDRSTNFNW